MLSNFSLLFPFLKKPKKYHHHPSSHPNKGTLFSIREKYCVILMTISWNMLKQRLDYNVVTHLDDVPLESCIWVVIYWSYLCTQTHVKQLYHHTIYRMYNINYSYPFNDGIFMIVRGGWITSLFFDTEAIAFWMAGISLTSCSNLLLLINSSVKYKGPVSVIVVNYFD